MDMFGEYKSKKAYSIKKENDCYDKEDGSPLALIKKSTEKAIQEEVVTMSRIYLPCVNHFWSRKIAAMKRQKLQIFQKIV